jgi:2-iminobutanoate/2-iminopropanoate deaminase
VVSSIESIKRIQLQKNKKQLYSDAILFSNVLWISGMLPTDREGNLVGKGDPASQADMVFQKIKEVLEKQGLDFSHIVKISIYLCNIEDRLAISEVREKYFGEQFPTSTLVEVSRLAHPDALLEIEAVAYVGESMK